MESLETFILSGCSNLRKFPEIDGKMDCLLKLYLDGTSIEELPSSIGKLSRLVVLNLTDCCSLVYTLNLSGCYKVENLPKNLQQVEVLEELDLSETAIREPPPFIFQYKNLEVLSFSGFKCPSSKLLQNLASLFHVMQSRTNSKPLLLHSLSSLSSLTMLKLRDCNLCEGDIPSDFSCLSSLKRVDLSGDIPSDFSCLSSLKRLDLSGNNFISIPPSLTRLSKLEYLGLSNCGICNLCGDIPSNISHLSSLTDLDLSGNNFISISPSLTRLTKLDYLKLSNCKGLELLPEFVTNIRNVSINNCASLEPVAIPSKVRNSMDSMHSHC
ncbi:hypothetical protein F3Y22_tig00111146pilonHSYRG00048 [Hibiscus syriacus]|uniref:Disease resistance protein RPS4B/Roq1-like leucine-rich repeats domain-containing protein n=1 Tax=Hibiscus syriacus TaxID=106335 RepID=A0A6A2YZE7_HIBSY|nr:hypothetical protein F3Y22_tig00111146pilonHSYRG00048 [Hibiscus syriacus]